jgi:photosystem II stability/assembly factor-like uncharacterized protein
MKVICRAISCTALLFLTLTLTTGVAFSQSLRAGYGVLRSTDNGKSWKQVFLSNFDADHLVIDKDCNLLASTMIVSSKKMLSELYSFDRASGAWQKLVLPDIDSKGVLISDLLATPAGPVFALVDRKILRTDDGGKTWTISTSSLPAKFRSLQSGPNQLLLGFTSDGLYQSRDEGKSWHLLGFEGQELDGGITLRDGRVVVPLQCKLFVLPVAPEPSYELSLPDKSCRNSNLVASDARGVLFANTSGGVFKSDATGKAWKKTLAFKEGVEPFEIAVAPDGGVFAVVLTGISNPTLFHSTDAGETWQMVRRLGPGVTISQFAFAPDGTIYAGLTSFGD